MSWKQAGLAEHVGMAPSAGSGGKPGMLYRFNADGVRSGAVFLRVDTVQVAVIDGNCPYTRASGLPTG